MRFDLLTIFPEFFRGPLDYGVVARARAAGLIDIGIHNLRDYTHDAHRTTDDRPFGGGAGMVLKPEPIYECLEKLLGVAKREERVAAAGRGNTAPPTRVILLSAQGRLFSQARARELAAFERLVLICGRYEGVDERVALHMADEELSVGDFVLSGGELPTAIVVDAVARLLPGVVGDPESTAYESFAEEQATPAGSQPVASQAAKDSSAVRMPAMLDYPHYTRPVSFQDWDVPEVLRGGDHAAIREWRKREALRKTEANRPDLLKN